MKLTFSIKALLAATAFVALGCVSLLHPNAVLAGCLLVATLLTLLAATTGAIIRQGAARAYWIGFTVFGVGYFGMAMFGERVIVSPTAGSYSFNWPTTNLIYWAYVKVTGDTPSTNIGVPFQGGGGFGSGGFGGSMWGTQVLSWSGSFSAQAAPITAVSMVGQSLFTLLFGFLGAWIGQVFYARGQRVPAVDAGLAGPGQIG